MRLSRSMLLVAAACWSIACGGGGDDDGGTNPNPTQVLGSIVPSVTTLAINAGQSSTITMTARDESGGTIAGASGYTYSSSAPAIAVVSGTGAVTGLSAGSATITVSLTRSGVTKTATVAVSVSGSLPNAATVIAGSNSDDFTPAFVAIARAGTVTWTFGARVHNVEFGSTSGAPANVPNTSNASVSRTFGNAGTFAYTCTLHANQNGTVLVP